MQPLHYLAVFCALWGSALWADEVTRVDPPRVEIFQEPSWSPTDFTRQGAVELDLLMRLVELQQTPGLIGIVGVGNRHGIFQAGVHRALEMAVSEGIPVVRLAQNGAPAAAGSNCVFINGGTLSVAEAELLLKQCLVEFGPLPQTADATGIDYSISPEITAQLARFQTVFDRGTATTVAVHSGRDS